MPKKPKPSTVHVDVTVVPAATLPCTVSLESSGIILSQQTNQDGWCRFDVPKEWRNTQLTVLTDSADYQDFGSPILLDGQPHEAPGQFWVTLEAVVIEPPPQPMLDAGERGPLHIDGLAFKREDGTVFPWRGCSDFSLFQRFVLGEDITPILDERIALGANILRVFGMYDTGIGNASGLGPFFPTWTGQQLSAFLNLLATRGLRCEFVIFADAQIMMPTGSTQLAHFNFVTNALVQHWNAVGEICNEPFKNGVDVSIFPNVPGLLLASGDYDDAVHTKRQYVTYHTDRKPEWPRTPRSLAEIRDDIDGGTHCPVVADEPTGAAEAPRGDSRSSTPSDFGYYAACAAQMGAGATFHSDDGIASRLLGPVQKDCARAFFAALAYIPPDCQFAPYTRGGANNVNVGDLPVVHHDLEEPTDPAALRSYSKTSSDGFNYYNRIRARGVTVMNPGWHQNEEPAFGIGRATR